VVIAGTSSDAGKSLVVTGLCRALRRRGIDVAPFKAQNMSNNSMVCTDGAEIGRAQYLQAQAAGVEPTSAMNPVLLKPGSDRRSFVVLRGRPYGTLEAGQYATGRSALREAAFAAYAELAETHDLIVAEGAGSPAEINLRAGDYVNLGLARRFDLPMVVVGDIDRGGVFASLYGTFALLEKADQAAVRGYVVNKFRGDLGVLEPGLAMLTERTGLACLGVLPWLTGVWLDAEDTLEVGAWRSSSRDARDHDRLRVAVVRLPRVSNITDVEALAAEPGVDVLVTTDPRVLLDADLVVLPGTRTTVDDLAWLRETGLAEAIRWRAEHEQPVLGVCGGFQMLARTIHDAFEGGSGDGADPVDGLGLLPVAVRFEEAKTLGRPIGSWRDHPVEAYEIHHGVAVRASDGEAESFLDGWRAGSVWGTMWHGTLENDGFRRAWLAEIAAASGADWRPDPEAPSFGDRRESMITIMADAVEEHLDLDTLLGWTRMAP
jgi:adenosylcobyric acid synthase